MAKTKLKKLAVERWRDLDGGSAFVIPLTALRHPNFLALTPFATKLLLDLGRQYTGFNNGFLCPAWTLMKNQGWKSRDTLFWATKELEHYRWIVLTRQGGKNLANLYGFTWRRIDEKLNNPDKVLDVPPSMKPSDAWKQQAEPFQKPARKAHKKYRTSTRSGLTSPAQRVNGSGVNTHGV